MVTAEKAFREQFDENLSELFPHHME